MKTTRLKFEISVPRVGWSHVGVECGDFTWQFLASNSPWDSIAELADAALGVLAGQPMAQARWHIEPGAFVFRFTRHGTISRFELLEYMDPRLRHPAHSEPIFIFDSDKVAMASAIWRSLRRLEGSVQPDVYQAEWKRPFPDHAVRRLGEAIRDAKKKSGEAPPRGEESPQESSEEE
jgi:hypothetical protein